MPLNVEIKAWCHNPEKAERLLLSAQPEFIGTDHQIDTYFFVPEGRLKLREGNIENALIFYHRQNQAAAKTSDVILYQAGGDPALKQILSAALGIQVIVDKHRKIYFVENVKFHFDTVEQLGSFVEIEAIDREGNISVEKLHEQCAHFTSLLDIRPEDLIASSYSDMLLAKKYSATAPPGGDSAATID